jgi:signal peptidase I
MISGCPDRFAFAGTEGSVLDAGMTQIAEPAAASPDAMHRTTARGETFEIVRTLVVALALSMVLRILLFQPFTIPSSSMEPGLVTGDYIVVAKYAYGWSRASLPFNLPLIPRTETGRLLGHGPERGDVVVFRLPRDPGQTWIKRVIGLPGDRVQVSGGVVSVNGVALKQAAEGVGADFDAPSREVLHVRETQPSGKTYVTYEGGTGPGDDTGVYVVPAGFYFMMGDNRDNSLDSRWPGTVGVGLLPAENIIGKAELVVGSWKPGSTLIKPWTWLNLRGDRFLMPIG